MGAAKLCMMTFWVFFYIFVIRRSQSLLVNFRNKNNYDPCL
jgi:hypothetical protein